jgi:hypothetical protein
MLTAPTMRTWCSVAGGIHIPRCGGIWRRKHDHARNTGDQLAASVLVRLDDMAVRIMTADSNERPRHMVYQINVYVSQFGPLS